MKTRRVKLNFKLETDGIRTDKGFALKREANHRECRHIVRNILRISIPCAIDFNNEAAYDKYNQVIKEVVNEWLVGKVDDSHILSFDNDCHDRDIGIFNAFKIAEYLKSREII